MQVQEERSPAQEAGTLQAESLALQNAQLQDLLEACRRELADVYLQVCMPISGLNIMLHANPGHAVSRQPGICDRKSKSGFDFHACISFMSRETCKRGDMIVDYVLWIAADNPVVSLCWPLLAMLLCSLKGLGLHPMIVMKLLFPMTQAQNFTYC